MNKYYTINDLVSWQFLFDEGIVYPLVTHPQQEEWNSKVSIMVSSQYYSILDLPGTEE